MKTKHSSIKNMTHLIGFSFNLKQSMQKTPVLIRQRLEKFEKVQ